MEFKATQLSIDDIFKLKRKYVIPRFQREYSWEEVELQTIWDDLLDSVIYTDGQLKTQEYFLGSLVLVGDDDSQNIERYVVDGQQRLITFTIAFSAIAHAFLARGEEKLAKATFMNVLAIDNDGIEYTKVQAETPKPFFQYRIQHLMPDETKAPQSEEETRILNAYTFFRKHLELKSLFSDLSERLPECNGKIDYISALKCFRDQILLCKVVYVTVKAFEDAYTIFEVLNAKGKNLSATDIIKNSIFSMLDSIEPLDVAADKWKCIRDNLTMCKTSIDSFYRHFWLSRYGVTTTKKLVSDFQRKVDRTQSSYSMFLKLMESDSRRYTMIVAPIETQWSQPEDLDAYNALQALSIFNTTQVRTFLLALLEKKDNAQISYKNFLRALTFLEHFHFVFTAVCSSRASGLEKRYSSYSRKLRICNNKAEVATCITDLIYTLKGTMPDYESFKNKFQSIQYTSDNQSKKSLVQYILKKYDAFCSVTKELKPQSFSIEHIVPESSRATFVGVIGNLLPLGVELNSEIGSKSFAQKLKYYNISQYPSTKAFAEQYKDIKIYNREEVSKRTDDIGHCFYYDIWNE